MAAQAPDRRTALVVMSALAGLLVALTLLLEPARWRLAAVALLAVGLAAGIAAVRLLPALGRVRTPMERLNDAAFLVVLAAAALIAVRLARPWTAALPGLVGGVLIGLSQRPPPGRAGTSPPGAEAPGGGA